MNIQEFKIGQEIVRVEPTKPLYDRSFIGDKMVLLDVCNGLIYLQTDDQRQITLEADIFSDGWEEYVEPNLISSSEFVNEFKQQLRLAFENEDYEFLAEVRATLDEYDRF